MFLWDTTFFSPIRVFFVAIHESMHAIATIITGGSVGSIGLTGYEGVMKPSENGFVPLVSVAGYLGTALIGGFLISTKNKSVSLFVISLIVFIFITIYIESWFSLEYIGVAFVTAIIFYLSKKGLHLEYVAGIVGSLLVFASLQDVKMYLLRIPGETDAGILANYLHMPFLTLPISIFMLLITVLIYYKAFKSRLSRTSNL